LPIQLLRHLEALRTTVMIEPVDGRRKSENFLGGARMAHLKKKNERAPTTNCANSSDSTFTENVELYNTTSPHSNRSLQHYSHTTVPLVITSPSLGSRPWIQQTHQLIRNTRFSSSVKGCQQLLEDSSKDDADAFRGTNRAPQLHI
jgi:hypothetical protein